MITTAINYLVKKETPIAEKGLLNLIQGEKVSSLHYLNKGTYLVSLTQGSSEKVQRLRADSKAQLSFTKRSDSTRATTLEVVTEKDAVQRLFDTMLEMKFTHYKKWNDDLVVIKMVL